MNKRSALVANNYSGTRVTWLVSVVDYKHLSFVGCYSKGPPQLRPLAFVYEGAFEGENLDA